ncbi:unnamed protein product [Paramecium octaurelia]|uniref:Uncharacterized protein n=1 Tax=Paramecium octaurelia TaxID=43137 RepID=A0A8S1YM88_PAROT|nr:unnamed protein product [Paramecium octaurelia]
MENNIDLSLIFQRQLIQPNTNTKIFGQTGSYFNFKTNQNYFFRLGYHFKLHQDQYYISYIRVDKPRNNNMVFQILRYNSSSLVEVWQNMKMIYNIERLKLLFDSSQQNITLEIIFFSLLNESS